ncbi:hypothetical protein [Sphingomonas sp.]|uniref:hypothetical protein n=1 Tax=Sphingomonas sp. TaxID=28214 RepID=UPI003B3BC3FD
MQKRYAIFADYNQFHLWDHAVTPSTALDYDDADIERRIKVAPFLVVIQPERNMEVQVDLEIADHAPDDSFDDWDHVAEASLDLPSGKLEIHQCTGGSVDILSVPPGTYRVRAYYGGLDTLSEDQLDGHDHYRLVVWPAPSAPMAVLKQFSPG